MNENQAFTTSYIPSSSSSTIIESAFENEIRRFSKGIRFQTVSNPDYQQTNFQPFDEFVKYLKDSYPSIFLNFEHYTVNTYGLIFKWNGKNKSLKPILFLSHYDVVPAKDSSGLSNEDKSECDFKSPALGPAETVMKRWEFPPFSGAIKNGRIYGRGTLDMKCMLFALLDAAERQLSNGFIPLRDIYFAFGHDEETGGLEGATKIAEEFKSKGIHFEAVFDEGGLVAASGTAGINRDLALIGLAEKRRVNLKIKVYGLGGHSSMPPVNSAVGMAAKIINRLERKQMKTKLIPPVKKFLKNVSIAMDLKTRVAIDNLWLSEKLLLYSLAKKPATNALIRTTTAVTMAKGSDAANVLPACAEFVVNFRILPGNTVEEVKEHVKKICKGFNVEIVSLEEAEPAPISPDDSKGYQVLYNTIQKVFPEAIITPYISIAATDAAKYKIVSENVYRFMPVTLNENEQRSIHNYNEYISFENYGRMISFFEEMFSGYDRGS